MNQNFLVVFVNIKVIQKVVLINMKKLMKRKTFEFELYIKEKTQGSPLELIVSGTKNKMKVCGSYSNQAAVEFY